MFNKNFQKRILLLIYFIFFINSKKVVFPFKEIEINSTLYVNDTNFFYNQIYLNNIYTKIKIGNPDQLILATFNSENTHLIIKDIPKLYNIEGYNTYNYLNSQKTFKNITSQNEENTITKGYSIINETIKLYKDKDYKKTAEIKDFQLELLNKFDYNDKTKTLSGEIGLSNENSKISFIKQLLNQKIIDSEIITINYNSDNNGYISLGECPDKIDKDKPIIMNKSFDGSLFQIEMDYVYMNHKGGRTFFSDTNLVFYFEQGIILASDGYQNTVYKYFFQERINKGLCFEENIYFNIDDYTAITCKEKADISNFPKLNFEINDKTFSLDYKDLFQKVNDIYYFLIVFSPEIKNWVIGKPFLKKYQLTFDNNKNEVFFIKNSSKSSKAWVAVLVIIIIIIILIIALFLFYRYKMRQKSENDYFDSAKGPLLGKI